jgi:hypothetical protein
MNNLAVNQNSVNILIRSRTVFKTTDFPQNQRGSLTDKNYYMKKVLLIALVLTAALSNSHAQKIKDSDVPQVVKNAFTKSYPGLSVEWEKEKGNYEAGFKKEGQTMSATFEPNGNFLESEVNIRESELPHAALSYIKTNYKDKKIKESAKITSAGGVITFEAEIDGKDVIFDNSGKFLKEVKD